MSRDTELGGNTRPGNDQSEGLATTATNDAEDEMDVRVDVDEMDGGDGEDGGDQSEEAVAVEVSADKEEGKEKKNPEEGNQDKGHDNDDPKEIDDQVEDVVIEEAVVVDEEDDDAEKEIDPNDIDDEEDDDVPGEMDEDEEEDDEENEATKEPMTFQDAREQSTFLEAELAAAVASIEQLEQRKRPAAKSFMRKEPPARFLRQPPAQPSPSAQPKPAAKPKRASSRKAAAPEPASAVLGDDVKDIIAKVTTNPRGTTRRAAASTAATNLSSPKKKTTKNNKKTPNKTKVTPNKKQPAKQPAAKAASKVVKPRSTPTRRASTSASPKGGRKASPLVSEGAPDDVYPGTGDWPAGWKKRVFQRQSGATKGQFDSYWYTPILQVKLRSMAEIRRWLAAMEQTNGDEEASRLIYKNLVV